MAFTDKDRDWLVTQLDDMESRQRVLMGTIPALTDLDTRLEHTEAKIKGDLRELEVMLLIAVDAKLEKLEAKLKGDLDAMEARLMTELHKWVSLNYGVMHRFKDLLAEFDKELDRIKYRLNELENKR